MTAKCQWQCQINLAAKSLLRATDEHIHTVKLKNYETSLFFVMMCPHCNVWLYLWCICCNICQTNESIHTPTLHSLTFNMEHLKMKLGANYVLFLPSKLENKQLSNYIWKSQACSFPFQCTWPLHSFHSTGVDPLNPWIHACRLWLVSSHAAGVCSGTTGGAAAT